MRNNFFVCSSVYFIDKNGLPAKKSNLSLITKLPNSISLMYENGENNLVFYILDMVFKTLIE